VTTDAWLAIAHHLAVFTLLGTVAAEWALLRPGIGRFEVERLARIDAVYGISALAVILAGVARVVWGASPADFYLENPVFWLKVGGFAAVVSCLSYRRCNTSVGADCRRGSRRPRR
jgi:putative membrane protein